MNLEKKNTLKRKTEPLSFSEKIRFFLFPFGFGSDLFPVKDFNDSEIERFIKHGFEKKFKDAVFSKKIGILFYLGLFLILLLSTLVKTLLN